MNGISVQDCSVCGKPFWAGPRDGGICFPCSHKAARERESEEKKKRKEQRSAPVIQPAVIKDKPVSGGYVYVMKSGQRYKIGMTSRKSGRLNEIKGLFPVIRLVLQIACHNAGTVETYLHKKYKKQRIVREWYKLEKQDLEWLKSLHDYELG